MDVMIPRIYRLGVVTCLAIVVMLVACTGGSEPAAPATTVAVGATTQPANTLVPAPMATPVPTPQQGQADEPRDASPAPTDRRTVGVSATCAGQRDALVALYNATDGDNWRGKDNWLTDHSMDTWFGVTADSDGCVTQLVLERNQLSGKIPAELGNLSNLERLGLDGNQLSGEIPPELGNLSNLEYLYLAGNKLTGEIPAELGSLSNLVHLNLVGNQLNGEMPPELGSLANLTSLNLSTNQLSGEIPPWLGNLAFLEGLTLPIIS